MTETALATTNKPQLMAKFAGQFGVEPGKLMDTLKSTAFRQSDGKEITNQQMMALIIVADQYGLNPFTKEIFAFPDKGGIVPVVGVDGWSRIVNNHPQFNGMDFKMNDGGTECTCTIWRKDREHPISVTEYLSEVKRDTKPWQSHPRRMLRHKTFIQCARLAFSYAGIYDEDEAERIIEGQVINITSQSDDTRALNDAFLGRPVPDETAENDHVAPQQPAAAAKASEEAPETPPPAAPAAAPATEKPKPAPSKHTFNSLSKRILEAKGADDLGEIELLAMDHLKGAERTAVLASCRDRRKELGGDPDAPAFE